MEGPFIGQRVPTLPVWTAADEGREIYTEDTKLRYYGTDAGWREYGSGGGGSGGEFDIYADMLGSSIYLNCSWDGFIDESRVDTINSTMTYNATDNKYEFTAGEVLQSLNSYDPTLAITVYECMLYIDFDDSGSPTIEVTADGVNWETTSNGAIHQFSNTGTNLKARITGGGNGEVRSWGLFYNPDPTPQQIIGAVPVGSLLMFGGTTAPSGYLLCDGSSYLVADYPHLFAAIGYTWGGAGANFNVPDFAQRGPYGPGGGRSVGDTDGDETKDIAHTHDFDDGGHVHTGTTNVFSSGLRDEGGGSNTCTPAHAHNFTTDSADATGTTDSGGSATQDVLNPIAVVNFIIKF